MERPTCETCPYWDVFSAGEDDGFCRRYAPRPSQEGLQRPYNPAIKGDRREVFPATTKIQEWCGEHPDFPAYIAALRAASAPQPGAGRTP